MYDLIILGAGPAGLAASIYASRYKIEHVVVGNVFNGAVPKAHLIENWPGEKFIKGYDLIMKFHEHAKSLGSDIVDENVVGIKKIDDGGLDSGRNGFAVITDSGKTYEAKSLLIALGTTHRKLNIPGEEEFWGKGVSYCAICDGAFFKNKIVAVAGGSNSAAMSASMLAEHASKVFIVYRGESLRCEPVVLEKLEKNPKVELVYNTNITKVLGEKKATAIEIDKEYKGSKMIKVDGLFIEVGAVPSVSLVRELGVMLDKDESIIVDQCGATNVEGVYAAGDITNGSNKLRQIVTAVSEGAIAATSIYKYLKEK